MTTIRPRDPDNDEVRPADCNPVKEPCENIWSKKPDDEGKQAELLVKCCSSGYNDCEDDESTEFGAGGFTNLIVNAYIKNSKLVKGNTQKTCIGKNAKPCGDLTQYDLIIDLSPPTNPEDKPKEGDKTPRGCVKGERVGKPNKEPPPGKKPVKNIGNFPIRIPINIIPGWNDQNAACPIVMPLLNLKIPNKKKCRPKGLTQAFDNFFKNCSEVIVPDAVIPGVCGPDTTPCNWTHFYEKSPPLEARDYYIQGRPNDPNDGLLKDVVNGVTVIKPGFSACKIMAKALLNSNGFGPTNTSGVPFFPPECSEAFGLQPINITTGKDIGGIKCPSNDFLTMCRMFKCMDDGKSDEDNVGVDDDGETIDINTSNITVSIVAKNQNIIASECLNGESPKSHQYKSGNDIYIDIHFGSECNEDNPDPTYKGVAICRADTLDCDTVNNYCTAIDWTTTPPEKGDFSDSCPDGYIVAEIFPCIDSDNKAITNYLNSRECKKDPLVWCCSSSQVSDDIANRLKDTELSKCCGGNDSILGSIRTLSEGEAKRICKPNVACCMAPPEILEGTCIYSQPGNIVSTAVFKYYYDVEITILKSIIGPNRVDFGSVTQTHAAVTNLLKALGLSSSKSTIWPLQVKLGLRKPGSYAWLDTLTPENTQQYYEEVVKFLFTNNRFAENVNGLFVTVKKNFSRTLEFNVENCDEDDAINNFYRTNWSLSLETLAKDMQDADPVGTNTFIDYLATLGIDFSSKKNPTDILPRKIKDTFPERAEIKFKPCVNTNWTMATIRTRTYAACAQAYRKIEQCCGGSGMEPSFKFIEDLVNEDLSTSPVKIDCSVDPKTGKLTCNNLPENAGNKCFVVKDTKFKASYECISNRKGRVVATEDKTTILNTCPEDVDCNDLEDPPEPQPVPDAADTDNPLDRPTVPDRNPAPDAPVDEEDPPPATECACLSINNRPTIKVNLPIKFREEGVDYNLDSPQKLNEYLNSNILSDGKINNTFIASAVQIALGIDSLNDAALRFTHRMIPCDCDKAVPDNPNAPDPKKDKPPSPPKRNPQQPPTNVECNGKKRELAQLKDRLQKATVEKLNLEQGRLAAIKADFDNNIYIWNNECSGISYALENWFSGDNFPSRYCQKIMQNICSNWDGLQSLPSNFPTVGTVMPFGKIQPNPKVVREYDKLRSIIEFLNNSTNKITELEEFISQNCEG